MLTNLSLISTKGIPIITNLIVDNRFIIWTEQEIAVDLVAFQELFTNDVKITQPWIEADYMTEYINRADTITLLNLGVTTPTFLYKVKHMKKK